MTCNTLGSNIETQLQEYGDYNCDQSVNIGDIVTIVNKIKDGDNNFNIGSIVQLINKRIRFINLEPDDPQNVQELNTILGQIASSQDSTQDSTQVTTQDSTQDSTQVTTQDLTQVTRQQAQDELDTAAASDQDIGINKLAIINVPRTPGTPADGFNIFFKGPEVLEYLVTFGTNVDSTSTIKTQENKDIFHNLFTTTNPTLYNSEQAFRIDGTKVYQARRSNTDTLTTTPWSTNLIHMFTSTYRITSLTKIQFSNGLVYEDAAAIDKYEIISPS